MPAQHEQSRHADTIIRNHVIWTMGAGLIPVPIIDIAAVSALQYDMIRQLCRTYGHEFTGNRGKAIVASITGSTLARVGAVSVAKMVPIAGSLVGGAAASVLAGASTYALGKVFAEHFESGGTILDFDTEQLKKMYKEKFEKEGKQVARDLKKEKAEATTPPPTTTPHAAPAEAPAEKTTEKTDILTRLKELGELKEKGILSEDEFLTMKQKLIDAF